MSWMKRPRGNPAAMPGPGQNIYSAAQPPLQPQQGSQQQQWPQPAQQAPAAPGAPQASYPAQPQQFWQPQQQQQPPTNPAVYNQNYAQQNYPPQPYPNDYYQYNQYQQNAPAPQFQQQQSYPHYQNPNDQYNAANNRLPPPPHQGYQSPQNNTQQMKPEDNQDNWDSNWDWDESLQTNNAPVVNNPVNANVLDDSFANSSWNWSVEKPTSSESLVVQDSIQAHSRQASHDSSRTSHSASVVHNYAPVELPQKELNTPVRDEALLQHNGKNANIESDFVNSVRSSTPSKPTETNVASLNDRDALIEHNVPNLAQGRRFHSDNLTPQWSIESQPSQDSSDGLLTSQTESTNRSEIPSRSSSKSSPGLNTDNTNFNYAQPTENSAWENQPYVESKALNLTTSQPDNIPDNIVNKELVDGIRTLSVSAVNRETVSPDTNGRSLPHEDAVNSPVLQDISSSGLPPSVPTPPLSRNVLPPSSSSSPKPVNQPPTNIPNFPPVGGSNPFKRAGQLSHKSANRSASVQVMQTPDNMAMPIMDPHIGQSSPFTPQQDVTQNIRQASPNLASGRSVVTPPTRALQNAGYATANLETTPDNSERPDNPSPISYRPVQYPHTPNVHHNIENFEVAPSNDRNEYLQTGHLSDVGYNDNTNFAIDDSRNNSNISQDNYPPPGFRRMVLGQPESEFGQNSSFSADEPPPGLSRMVPGQPTDSLSIYNQPNDDYLDRQVDGQTTESDSLTNSACMNRTPAVYRQVDGQPTDDESNYNQTGSNRSSSDRRPIGFDRMVPGESSNNFSMQNFQSQNFGNASEERVVTGFEQANSTEPREQNMDGSDYSEVDTNQMRSVEGAVEMSLDSRNIIPENMPVQNQELELQRDLNMEGENLQDLSVISSTDFSMVRDQNMDGADIQDEQPIPIDSGSDLPTYQKGQLPNREQMPSDKDRKYRDDTTGDESERDRLYNKTSPRKEKDRLRTSKERDGRYNDRRDERRQTEKDRYRNERDSVRGDDRRYRKSNKDSRYETEDTDYYSDRDRNRRYREGSYSSKPPRPETSRREDDSRRSYDRSIRDDKDRRRPRDERDRRYDSYESERDARRKDRYARDEDSDRRHGAERDRNYASLRKDRSGGSREDRKRGDPRYPPRPDSRDPDPTEDELLEAAEREQRRQRRARDPRDRDRRRERAYNDQYYERYGYPMDQYSQQVYQQQQQTYQYYEKLRVTNPQAYLEIYNKYMAGAGQGGASLSQNDVNRGMAAYGEGYASLPGYDTNTSTRLGDERGSVHSGRSSANGEGMKDRTGMESTHKYYYAYRRMDPALYGDSPSRRPASVRTDHSGSRDFNTDASLNLVLEDSTVRSERMTPVKFATAHIKGVISSTNMITINPSYPVDGQPAIVEILDINKLLANDPVRCELTSFPGPLVKGTTHKKTVIEYCESKIRSAIDKFASPLSHSHPPGTGYLASSSSQSDRPTLTGADLASQVLMWELLILLLRQNGMVVGTDIAELLVKNARQYTWRGAGRGGVSRRDSASSASADLPAEEPQQIVNSANQEVEQDSSNEVSTEQAMSSSRKPASANPSSRGRKTSSNLHLEALHTGEKYVTDRFREYLLFGSGKEALEWAMSHGLWGHALFLASKLDRRTYANVMARFANGLSACDPLQTLYQLMSGRQPAAVTCVLDEKWGDWRPHLAMILSNTSQRPELDRKSITALGDTLQSRGDLYAAQFCYLMARVEFGSRPPFCQSSGVTVPAPRLVLLGASVATAGLAAFATNPAIIMTEIYEYACSLADDSFVLVDFQVYKYLFATRLTDYGLYDRSLFYMERLAHVISLSPDKYEPAFVNRVLQLADRLKHYDPEENVGDIIDDDQNYGGDNVNNSYSGHPKQAEQDWITGLRKIVNDFNTGAITHESPQLMQNQSEYDTSQNHNQFANQTQNWNQSYQPYDQLQPQPSYQPQEQNHAYQQHDQPGIPDAPEVKPDEGDPPQMYDPVALQNNSTYFSPAPVQYEQDPDQGDQQAGLEYAPPTSADSGYWNQEQQNHQQGYGYNEPDAVKEEAPKETADNLSADAMDPPRPQISMPNSGQAAGRSAFLDDRDSVDRAHDGHTGKSKEKPKKEEAGKAQANSGWFGGIFNKLSLKPKNQMILPDDKNPTIVWDPDKKRWMNKDADEDEQNTTLALPPKMTDIIKPNLNNSYPSRQQLAPPPGPQGFSTPMESSSPMPAASPTTPNIFKLQKGRHIKKSYVDVFNPSGAPTRPLPPASEVLGAPPAAAPTSYFVPAADKIANQPLYNPADY